MGMRGARLLRTSTRARTVRSAVALLLGASVSASGFVALALPAHAGPNAPSITSPSTATVLSRDASTVLAWTDDSVPYECSSALATSAPSWQDCSTPWDATLGADGTYDLSVREKSVANDGTPATVAYTLDTHAQLSVVAPASPQRALRPTWTVSTEPSGSVSCVLDSDPATDCTNGFTPATDLTEGSHTLTATATDPAGNTSAPDVSTYVLDLTAPSAPTVTGSSGTHNDTTPTWSWTNSGSTALCTLDTPSGPGTEVGCASGVAGGSAADVGAATFSKTVSAQGDYQLSVVLVDAAGNRSAAGTGPTYTLDTLPSAPAVFGTAPTSPSTSTSVTWTFTEPGTSSTCTLVGASQGTVSTSACTSPKSYTGLADDSYTLVVTEDDGVGNTVSTTSPSAYVVDTTGPAAPVVTAPSGLSNNGTPHVTWTGELPSTATCRWERTVGAVVTDGAWVGCDARFFDPVLPGDGSYVFQAQLVDPLGNVGTIGTSPGSYVYDGTAPAAPVLVTPATPDSDPTPTVSFSPEVPGGTATCSFWLTATPPATPTWTDCTSGSFTPTLPSDGTWTLAVRLADAAGNVSTPSTFDYVLDTAAPTPVVVSGPTGPSNVTSPVFTLVGDPGDTITCQVFEGIPATTKSATGKVSCTTSYSPDLKGKKDGPYSVVVTAKDTAKNTAVTSWPYTLDTTAPNVPVVSGPTGTGNAAAPSWSFPVQANTTAQCQLAQGVSVSAWSDCSTGHYTVTSPADGTYTVNVLVTDLAGNQAAIASSAPYTSDRTAPSAPVVSGPTGPGNVAAPTWTWTGEAGATATCRLDRAGVIGSAVPCNTGSFAPALSGDTSYVVVVQLTDAAGNPGPATSTAPYLLDTVAPAAPVIQSGPTGSGSTATVSWTWSSEAGSTSRCTLVRNGVAGSAATCTSGASRTLPSDATYALQVTVLDAAGNASTTVQTAPYALDRVAPAAPVVTTPVSPSNSATPAFTFTAEAGSVTQCRLLRSGVALPVRDWTACTSPPGTDLTGLVDGTYTLEVRATDAAGNTGASGSSLGYQYDATAPAAPVVTVPASPSQSVVPSITWTGEAGTTATCRLVQNGTNLTPVPCSSPWTPTLSGDGTYVARVRLTDAAGNQSQPGVSSAYLLDTTPPTAPVVSPPGPLGRSTAPSWSATFESGATAECKVTTGSTVVTDWTSCSLPYVTDLSTQLDGTYTLSVRVTDAVGLVSPVGSATYQLDTTAPSVPVFTSVPASPGKTRALSFSFTSDPGTTSFCKLTSGGTTISAETTCTSPLPVSLAGLPDGVYTLGARSVDAAGNSSASQTATYVLDTVAPGAPVLIGGPAATAPDKTPTWSFSAEAGATLTCKVTGALGFATTSPCSSPFVVTLSTDDTYTFTVTATDAAGNTGPSLSRSYVLDSTAPATADVVGPKSPGKVVSPIWQVTSSEGTTQCQLIKGAATVVRDWQACGPTFSVLLPGDGTYTLSARVIDSAGNFSPVVTSGYVLDTVPPTAATVVTPASPSTDRNPTFAISSSDPTVTAQCQVTGPFGVVTPFASCPISAAGSNYNLDLSSAADGSYTLSVKLTDAAGNLGPTSSGTYVLDSSAPNPVLVTAPVSPSQDSTPTWSFVGDTDSTLECRLSGPGFVAPPFSACPVGALPGTGTFTADLTAKPDGTFTMTARSRDAAGNLGPETSSSYELDRTAPATPAAPSVPPSPSNAGTIAWTFSVEAGTTAHCALSSASGVVSPDAVCTSPLTTTLPGDGTYTLTLTAVDDAGNTSAAASASYVFDSTPPAPPTISTSPGSPNPNAHPTWNITPSEAGDQLQCQLVGLNGAGFAPCASPVTYDLTGQPQQAYHLEVVETDAAGNQSSPPAVSPDYVYDTTAPPAADVTAAQTIGHSTHPVFHIALDDPTSQVTGLTCTVKVAGSTLPFVATPCLANQDSVVDLSALPAGTETTVDLEVLTEDAAHNTQDKASVATYTFDSKAPLPPTVTPAKPFGLDKTTSWTFFEDPSEQTVTFACGLAKKGAVVPALTSCTSPRTATLASFGEWALSAAAVDRAGNVSPVVSASYDYLPPVPAITAKAPLAGPDTTPTWTLTLPSKNGPYTALCVVSDGSSTLDEGDCTSGQMTADLTGQPGGYYDLSVRLTDSHANQGAFGARSRYHYVPRTKTDTHLGHPGPTTPGPTHQKPPSTPTGPGGPSGPGQPVDGGTVVPPAPIQHRDNGGSTPGQTGAGTPSSAGGKTTPGTKTQAAGIPSPGQLITKEATKAIGNTLAQVAQKPTIPLLLLGVVVGFLLLQNRIDRRDPKLASAPVGAEPELDFGPVQGLGGGAPA